MVTNKRGPKTKENIISEIVRLKRNNQKITAKGIQRELKKKFKDSFVPKERTIANIIKKNEDKTKFDPIDSSWTVACCMKAEIPGDIVPLLLSIQQKLPKDKKPLTIRLARWIAKLYPSLYPILLKECPNDQLRIESRLFECAYNYASWEEIAEIEGDDYPDSSPLDDVYFNRKQYFFDMPSSASEFQDWTRFDKPIHWEIGVTLSELKEEQKAEIERVLRANSSSGEMYISIRKNISPRCDHSQLSFEGRQNLTNLDVQKVTITPVELKGEGEKK